MSPQHHQLGTSDLEDRWGTVGPETTLVIGRKGALSSNKGEELANQSDDMQENISSRKFSFHFKKSDQDSPVKSLWVYSRSSKGDTLNYAAQIQSPK